MGKWVKERLGAKSTISRGGSPRPIEDYVSPEFEGYNWIKIGDVKPGAKYIESTAEKMIPAGLTKTREVHAGDFLLSNSMSFGRPYISKIDGCIHDGWLAIQSYHETFDTNFLYYCLGAESTFAQYRSLAAGSTVLNLKKEMVAKVNVTYPVSLDEQRHIAEILTTCDEVIEKSEAVAEKYRAIKAGMLNDLFTRGIGKNGKLRPPPESAPQLYKDTALGKVPREWEVKSLGSVCSQPQYGLNVAAVKYDGKHGYLRITDIDEESHLFIRQGITSPSMYEEIYRAQEGDVFFARTGASTGKTYLYQVEDGELYFAGFLIKFHCKERVNSAYVFYQTLTTRYLNWVSAVSTRTGQPGINSQELSTFRMAIPSDLAEQQQIAERLSAIDVKIADELAVVAKYRKVKAGLMARLLTPPDMEVE